jgi:two-component system sensor histidine kinase KdpD
MQVYRRAHAIDEIWPTTERLLVCVSPSPLAARLVRAARRMAARLRAEWLVVYVETPANLRLPEADRDRVVQTLRLAKQLGAETVTLSGQNVTEEILTYARTRNVSKIVVGKPTRLRWRERVFGSVVDELVWRSDEIDVYVLSGEEGDARPPTTPSLEQPSDWPAYGRGLAVVVLCTALAWLMRLYFAEANLIMVYLLGVVMVARRYGRGPSILASVLSAAAFYFFFVPPYLTFTVSYVEYLVTLAVMLLVALIISTLTVRLRQQAEAAHQREQRTAALYSMSRDLASIQGTDGLLEAATRHISEVFESQVVLLLPDANGRLQTRGTSERHAMAGHQMYTLDAKELGVAQWVYEHQQMAGLGTATLPSAQALYLPLIAARGVIGVLGMRPAWPRRLLALEQVHLLETFASQTALAMERATLAEEAHNTKAR